MFIHINHEDAIQLPTDHNGVPQLYVCPINLMGFIKFVVGYVCPIKLMGSSAVC